MTQAKQEIRQESEGRPAASGEPFHQLLTGAQSSLYAFICSLLGRATEARDILQETNLVLWEKSDLFDRSRAFLPWAFRFAHLQVLAFRKRHQRDRLLFDDEMISTLADEFAGGMEGVGARLEALDECVCKLSMPHQDLLRLHYEQGVSLTEIGQTLGKQSNTMAAFFYRLRKTLSGCVEQTLKMEGTN